MTFPYPIRTSQISFVNAIFRRIGERGKQELMKTSVLDNIHPWLAQEWIKAYGQKATDTIVSAAMKQSPIFVTVNGLYRPENTENFPSQKSVVEFVQEAFTSAAAKIESADKTGSAETVEILPIGCIRVPKSLGGTVSKWPLYKEGAWWVQDPSATLPAIGLFNGLQQLHDNRRKKTATRDAAVVDLCSAPGGKTAQLCSMGFHSVDAVEVSKARSKTLEQNLQRLGMSNRCVVTINDGRTWLPASGSHKVDAVLLDAPCSATGLGSRRPDILRKPLDGCLLDELILTQRHLMTHAVEDILRPDDGILVYATCSLLKQEGEDQVKWLLERQDKSEERIRIAVETLPFLPGELPGFDNCIDDNGWLRILPGMLEGSLQFCDGFFVARLKTKLLVEEDFHRNPSNGFG